MPYNVFKPESPIFVQATSSANNLGTERSPHCKRTGIGHLSSSPLPQLPQFSLENSAHLMAQGPGHNCPNLSQTGISDLACPGVLLAPKDLQDNLKQGRSHDALRTCPRPKM